MVNYRFVVLLIYRITLTYRSSFFFFFKFGLRTLKCKIKPTMKKKHQDIKYIRFAVNNAFKAGRWLFRLLVIYIGGYVGKWGRILWGRVG